MEKIKENFDTDWEQAKGGLIYRLINKDRNEGILADIPGICCGDMVLICSVLTEGQGTEGAFPVSNTQMEQWKKIKLELFQQAAENTEKLLPPMTGWLDDFLAVCLRVFRPEEDHCMMKEGGASGCIYLVTNQKLYYGAAAIFYEGILDRAAEKLEADLFLLPSCVHEFLAVPDNGNLSPSELEKTVRMVNQESVPEKEILSEKVYHYSRKTGRIRSV